MNTITLTKKKIYKYVLDSDDSTSGLDNNHAMLQHNKQRITVKSDEKEHTQEEDTQAEERRRIKQKEICGEELNTEQYAWYRDDTELYTQYAAKMGKHQQKHMTKDDFFASYLKRRAVLHQNNRFTQQQQCS